MREWGENKRKYYLLIKKLITPLPHRRFTRNFFIEILK